MLVKPERDQNPRSGRRDNWWLFGETMPKMREAISGINKYIATSMTAKHRVFLLVDSDVLADQGLIAIALQEEFYLGLLSSYAHVVWSLVTGGTLEDRPRYNNSRCFETFPFPSATEEQQEKIRALAEQLDAHRKKQQAQHAELTLTGMYNVLEKLKSGDALNSKEKIIHEHGLVSVLKQLHDELDLAVLDAYGWSDLAEQMQVVNGNAPVGAWRAMPLQNTAPLQRTDVKRALDETLLERLVALNTERADEEKRGIVRWLRPEFQNKHPQGTAAVIATQTEMDVDTEVETAVPVTAEKQPWPKDDIAQVKAVADVLAASKTPLDLDAIAAHFTGKGPWKKRLPSILEMLVVVGKVRVENGVFGCV